MQHRCGIRERGKYADCYRSGYRVWGHFEAVRESGSEEKIAREKYEQRDGLENSGDVLPESTGAPAGKMPEKCNKEIGNEAEGEEEGNGNYHSGKDSMSPDVAVPCEQGTVCGRPISGMRRGVENVYYQKRHYRRRRLRRGSSLQLLGGESAGRKRGGKEYPTNNCLGIRSLGSLCGCYNCLPRMEGPFTGSLKRRSRRKDEPSANAGGSLLFREDEMCAVRADYHDSVHRLVPWLSQKRSLGELLLIAEADAEPFARDKREESVIPASALTVSGATT